MPITDTPEKSNNALTETLTISNDIMQVASLNTFVKSLLCRIGVESKMAKKLQLGVEEAVVNVIDYAYPPGTQGTITLNASYDRRQLRFVITDTGVPFDPTLSLLPDITLNAEDRPIGGLGILLMRELTDDISYERTDGKNILTLIFSKVQKWADTTGDS